MDGEAISTMQATFQGLPLREVCSAIRDYPQGKGGGMIGYGSNLSNAPSGADYDPYCPWNSSYIDDDAEELLEPQACVDCGKDAHPESEDSERCAACELKAWQQGDNETEIAKWERLAR